MKRNFFIILFLGIFSLLQVGCSTRMMADLKLDMKNYPEAINLYNEYLSKNPNSIEAMNSLGLAYLFSGRFDESISQFRTVLEKSSDNSRANLRLGQAYVNVGDLNSAMDTWAGYSNFYKLEIYNEVHSLRKFLQMFQNKQLSQKAASPKDENLLKNYRLDMDQFARLQLSDITNIVNHSIEKAVALQNEKDCQV